jgi:hypothetical protein
MSRMTVSLVDPGGTRRNVPGSSNLPCVERQGEKGMMKTQSADTHPDTEKMLIHLIQNAPVSKRFRLIQSLTQGVLWSHMQSWRKQHPNVSEQEAAVQIVSFRYGPVFATQVKMALAQCEQWSFQPTDLLIVMLPALHIFDERDIFCYLGGSIASSLHGMQQMAQDIDLIVDLDKQDLSSLLSCLKQHYVLDEDAFKEAVFQRTACSLIHLDTLMKIDVVMTKQDALDAVLHHRIASYHLDERYPSLRLASATEMIMVKLYRYAQDLHSRTDGMRDDAEWNDIVGMFKVQRPNLEKDFLEKWAKTLKITETLEQALVDAGAEHEAVA